ncbi:SubName: Full=Uncharacterized protein {ECO:0000313/EMBL:CCA74784.1} [Serendipita indica DSM 11827]|nr:SubName: Full=Uncharacterized protein {ECO:0000313/EMBL:CCA74784.1} [Serendipita indica DSM 11827]
MSVALILGAGSRVGSSVASKLVANGYKVALGSRSGGTEKPEENTIGVKVDVAKPDEVAAAFVTAEKELGAPVNVVVFNTAGFSPLPVPGEPFSKPYDRFLQEITVGALGAYAALHETIKSFKRVSEDKPKVFIATSNLLGVIPPVTNYFTLGNEKHNLAYYVQAGNTAHADQGFRFYLAAQVSPSGGIPPGAKIDGEAHATAYWNLINRKERGGWDIRFIQDGSILVEN